MAGERVPVVLAPRYTTYLGQISSFQTFAIDVRDYSMLELSVWRGQLLGTTPAFLFHAKDSNDRVTWQTVQGTSGMDPGEDTEADYVFGLNKPWFRLQVLLTGTHPGVTWWAQGFLIKREK